MLFGTDLGLSGTLHRMNESQFEFHLTGSRFFGNYGLGSDYDFFVQFEQPFTADSLCDTTIVKELVKLGFRTLMGSDYTDKLTVAVYRKPATKDECQIDVQLCLDAALKSQVQEVLRQTGALETAKRALAGHLSRTGTKKHLFQIWDTAIATVQSIQDAKIVSNWRM